MARLNKTQIYAIRWLNHQECSNEKIANELGLNIEQISKALEKYTKTSHNNSVETKTSPVNVINKTSGKGISNVSIMTKEASEAIDQMSKNTSKSTLINQSIFRPKNG